MKATGKASAGYKTPAPPFSQRQISPEQLNERIRRVAQGLYEKRGRVPGHELEDWLEAEKQVKKEFNLA